MSLKKSLWCGLLAACGLSLAPVAARAGFFDFLRLKKAKPAATVARGQAPDPRYAPFPTPNGWQPPAGGGPAPMPASDPYAGSGWGYESSPCYNCGEMDRHQGWVQHTRKTFHQTYYPRSAPYCQPEWGWHQSCWRRMRENYACQRCDYHASTPQPAVAMPPAMPVMPPDGAPPGPQSRAYPPSRTVGYTSRAGTSAQRATGSGTARYMGSGSLAAPRPYDPPPGEWIEIEEPADGGQFESDAPEAALPEYPGVPQRR